MRPALACIWLFPIACSAVMDSLCHQTLRSLNRWSQPPDAENRMSWWCGSPGGRNPVRATRSEEAESSCWNISSSVGAAGGRPSSRIAPRSGAAAEEPLPSLFAAMQRSTVCGGSLPHEGPAANKSCHAVAAEDNDRRFSLNARPSVCIALHPAFPDVLSSHAV